MSNSPLEHGDAKAARKCFVLMPFSVKDIDKTKYTDPNHWAEVYEGLIRPAVSCAGLECEREDMDVGSRLIVESILSKIEKSDIILCDLSSHNPNVFLELGWALRANKPYVLAKDDLTTFTFDLASQYTFEYDHKLQPTRLKDEVKKLSEVVSRTLDDEHQRYSVVRSMSISSSAIEAATGGDYPTQLLLDIQRRLKTAFLPNSFMASWPETFPWPELLRRALDIMFAVRKDLSGSDGTKSGLVERMRSLTRTQGITGKPDMQLSIINASRTFVYHDWEFMIGARANYMGLDGVDMYDEVFDHPHGAVAWADRCSNVQAARPPYLRANIAVFTTLQDSEWRVVVETHQEIS